jgi:putative transferase (TIGR04331 family)
LKSDLNRYYLVTTADERTWPKEKKIIFLGEWCKRFSRKSEWSNINSKVLKYHWDDRNKLENDFIYLNKIIEDLLELLTNKLNEIHNEIHNKEYWRLIIGPWLGIFTQIVFDRWSSLNQAISNNEIEKTIILKNDVSRFVPNDINEFMGLLIEDSWNHFIYSEIIKKEDKINFVYNQEEIKYSKKIKYNTTIKSFLKKILQNILIIFQKKNDAFLITTYLNPINELKLNFKLKQIPQIRSRVEINYSNIKLERRNWEIINDFDNDFERVIKSLIPNQIPKIYVEGYSLLKYVANKQNWPYNPKFIFTSNSHYNDDVFNAWTAKKIESGTPLLIGQHGGYYGIGKFSFIENHEINISTRFLTWGWTEINSNKITPVGMLKTKKIKIDYSNNNSLLLVQHINPRQSYHLFSSAISSQWLEYLNDQFQFVEKLPQAIKKEIIVRLHPKDYGWDSALRWSNKFPTINIDKGKYSIHKQLSKTKIYVSTYNATTFLESISLDIPTVIFWNPNHWELRDSAIPFFSELEEVGIFHRNPESAANHVYVIWEDVVKWWMSDKVRVVLIKFKKNYCNVTKSLATNIYNIAIDSIN